ncbi:hypothetical protein HYR99_36215, partial [Candidatus Poribacteria bacterium]|nr:hypothetical protein [Candidatus Poribacteria bacterium]
MAANAVNVKATLSESSPGKIIVDTTLVEKNIPGGGSATFEWRYRTEKGRSASTQFFSANASGKGENSEQNVSAAPASSKALTIQTPAALSAALSVLNEAGQPIQQIIAGQKITVQLDVTNSGQADAVQVQPQKLTLTISGVSTDLPSPSPKTVPGIKEDKKGTETFKWEYQTQESDADKTATLSATVTGRDINSNEEVTAKDEIPRPIVPVGLLVTKLTLTPDRASEGQGGTIEMVVENQGKVTIFKVVPALSFTPENNLITPSAPEPASADIPAGTPLTYRWTYQTIGGSKGTYSFTGRASGGDNADDKIAKPIPSKNQLSASLTVEALPLLVIQSIQFKLTGGAPSNTLTISEGQPFDVVVKVKNNGEATATEVRVDLKSSIPEKFSEKTATSTQDIPGGGGERELTFSYNTIERQSASVPRFTAPPSGRDKNSGKSLPGDRLQSGTSQALTIQTSAKLDSETVTRLVSLDEKGGETTQISPEDNKKFTVKLEVTNTGQATAEEVEIQIALTSGQSLESLSLTLIAAESTLPPAKATISGGAKAEYKWVYQINDKEKFKDQTLTFTAIIKGKDGNSKQPLPEFTRVVRIRFQVGPTITAIRVSPTKITSGQTFTVEMDAKNLGNITVLDVKPAMRFSPANGQITPGQPDPPMVTIGPGETKTYRWTYQTQTGSEGEYTFIGGAEG